MFMGCDGKKTTNTSVLSMLWNCISRTKTMNFILITADDNSKLTNAKEQS